MSGRYVVSAEFVQQVNELMRWKRTLQPQRSFQMRRPRFTQYPSGIAFYNNSGETIPAFGVMKISSESSLSDSQGYTTPIYIVTKPDTTFAREYLVNGSDTVAANAYGTGSFVDIADRVLYDSADGTPAINQVWGAYPSSWKLRRNMYGFRIRGDANTSTTHVRAIQEFIHGPLIGKADGVISAGSTGTVSVWKGSRSADSTANVAVTSIAGISSTSLWVAVHYISETAYASLLECG